MMHKRHKWKNMRGHGTAVGRWRRQCVRCWLVQRLAKGPKGGVREVYFALDAEGKLVALSFPPLGCFPPRGCNIACNPPQRDG